MASIRQRMRSASAVASIAATLPPCEFITTSLRQPARATLSPISVQARIAVSGDSVSVPGYSECSPETPTVCSGRNRTGRSSGILAAARST